MSCDDMDKTNNKQEQIICTTQQITDDHDTISQKTPNKNYKCLCLCINSNGITLIGDTETETHFNEKYSDVSYILGKGNCRSVSTQIQIYAKYQKYLLQDGYKYSHTSIHVDENSSNLNTLENWFKEI